MCLCPELSYCDYSMILGFCDICSLKFSLVSGNVHKLLFYNVKVNTALLIQRFDMLPMNLDHL